jgi:hypothetical protein
MHYWFNGMLIPFLIFSLAALGLNILTGYAGQLSLGTAAFMAIGAFMAYNAMLRIPHIPVLGAFAIGGLSAAAVGFVFGLPSLRIKGLYLAVATLACQFFVLWLINRVGWFSNHSSSGVITAQRFADKRFAFGPWVLLTDHLPALVTLIGHELGPAGALMLIAGGVAAIRRRHAGAAVLAGAGVGMLAIALNIAGDLKGFITPVMVFAWPFTALGITALAQWLVGLGLDRRLVAVIGVLLSVTMPLANARSNFKDADQSGNHEAAGFHVALFTQLPRGAALVIEDYASDMALYYYKLTGEAGPRQDLMRVAWSAVRVRAAAREHRVFAYARAAAVLQAQGLAFERWNVAGPSLDEWVGALPAGSLIAGAKFRGENARQSAERDQNRAIAVLDA